jgi:multidrug transporter EmrE-like cation transporter
MSCKALGIALKLTFAGSNQLAYPQTYAFAAVVAAAVVTQMNYLNKALDLFNTAIVTPIYYVMFTTLTIAASSIMFNEPQSAAQLATQLSGFATIVCGTFLLHATKDLDMPLATLLGGRGGGGGGGGGGGRDVGDLEMAPLVQRGSGVGQRKGLRAEEGQASMAGGDRHSPPPR